MTQTQKLQAILEAANELQKQINELDTETMEGDNTELTDLLSKAYMSMFEVKRPLRTALGK